MIKFSFKKAGINLIIEDIKKIKQNNFTNQIDFENNSINSKEDKDSDNDNLFDTIDMILKILKMMYIIISKIINIQKCILMK